jgi:hypothetical protein
LPPSVHVRHPGSSGRSRPATLRRPQPVGAAVARRGFLWPFTPDTLRLDRVPDAQRGLAGSSGRSRPPTLRLVVHEHRLAQEALFPSGDLRPATLRRVLAREAVGGFVILLAVCRPASLRHQRRGVPVQPDVNSSGRSRPATLRLLGLLILHELRFGSSGTPPAALRPLDNVVPDDLADRSLACTRWTGTQAGWSIGNDVTAPMLAKVALANSRQSSFDIAPARRITVRPGSTERAARAVADCPVIGFGTLKVRA